MRPLSDESVWKVADVKVRNTPSRCDPTPAKRYPACCQKMLEAWGILPPVSSDLRITFAPVPATTLPVLWKMKIEVDVPSRKILVAKLTLVVQVYTPATNISPPMRPALTFLFAFDDARAAASV